MSGSDNARPAHRSEDKLDATIEDSFPASDPPSITPPAGTRTSRETAEAHSHGRGDDIPKAAPTDARHATETAAARIHGADPAETDDHTMRD